MLKKTKAPLLAIAALGLFMAQPLQAAWDCCQTQIQLLQQILEAVHRVNVGNVQSNKELDETLARQADSFSNALKKELNEKAYIDAMTRDYRDPTRYSCAVGTMGRGEQIPDYIDPQLVQVLMNVNLGDDANTPIQSAKMINVSCNLGVMPRERLGSELRCPVNQDYLNGDTSLDIGIFKNKCIEYDPNGLRSAMTTLARPNSPLSPSDPNYEAALAAHAVQVNIGLYDPFPSGKQLLAQSTIPSVTDHFSGTSRVNAANNALLQALSFNTCFRRDLKPGCERGQPQREALIREQYPEFRDFPKSSNFCHSQYIFHLAELAEIKKKFENASAAGEDAAKDAATQVALLRRTEIKNRIDETYRLASVAASSRTVNDPGLGPVNKPIQAELKELRNSIKELVAVMREQQQGLPGVREAAYRDLGSGVRDQKKARKGKPGSSSEADAENESALLETQDALKTLGIKVSEKISPTPAGEKAQGAKP